MGKKKSSNVLVNADDLAALLTQAYVVHGLLYRTDQCDPGVGSGADEDCKHDQALNRLKALAKKITQEVKNDE